MSVLNASKFLGNLIFKKSVQKQTGIMKTINPMEKKLAENKAKFALEQIQKNNNIDINNLSANDLEMLAENIVNPLKNATKTPVKSADILDFRYKRNFAEELADASKKGDFKQMTGIMKVDPKFKEVMESLKASKAADAAKAKMIGPKKLIPDRDVIPYLSPEVQKLDFADKLKRAGLTEQEYMNNIVKRGYNVDDAIYARDFYGDTTDQIIKNANTKGAPVAFAGGGVAGLLGERPRQNFAMGKRAFLKLMGGVGAGIAGLKTGLLGLGKKTAVKEAVKQTAGSGTPPPYFFKLVEKIKTLGDDVTVGSSTIPRTKVTQYKNYELTENLDGSKQIQKMGSEDDMITKNEYMTYTKGQADETTKGKKVADEYEEVTESNSRIYKDAFNDPDYEDGIDLKEILEEVGETAIKKADGGRIGFKFGSGKGIMATINKLFGKGTMTTADKLKRPQKALDREMFKRFETKYPETSAADAITIEPRKFIDVPPMPKGFKLSREKLEKNYPELDEDMIDQIMELDKDMQGTVLTMLKNRRKNPDAYDKLLETKGDTLEFQGAFDEVTRKSNNADGGRIGLSTGGLAAMLGE